MNSEEIIKEITPINLQKGHCQHDYLHDFIMDAHSTILRNRKYKDESCRLCYGEPEATYSNYFEPLLRLVAEANGNILPSKETYKKYARIKWQVSERRRKQNIYQILYACRYKQYPDDWIPLVTLVEQVIRKGVPDKLMVTYLPALEYHEKLKIRSSILEELKADYWTQLWPFYQRESPLAQASSSI
jgi:hypothetical protein